LSEQAEVKQIQAFSVSQATKFGYRRRSGTELRGPKKRKLEGYQSLFGMQDFKVWQAPALDTHVRRQDSEPFSLDLANAVTAQRISIFSLGNRS
jgi:hypothetical protein